MSKNTVPEYDGVANLPPIEGREAAERFVDLLTRGEYRSLYWRLIPRKGFDGTIREPVIPLNRFYEDGFDGLQGDYNVYAVVNGGGRRDAHIDHVRAFFIDADEKNNIKISDVEWHVEPHFLSIRTELNWHAWWLAADFADQWKCVFLLWTECRDIC